MVCWTIKKGTDLNAEEIYEILHMRNEVFTVEQSMMSQDADNLDLLENCYHVIGTLGDCKGPVAYSRLIVNDDHSVTLGRLLVMKDHRKTGLGQGVLQKSLDTVEKYKKQFGTTSIIVQSQFFLREWFQSYGFEIVGDAYEVGRIMHVDMKKEL